MELAIKKLSLSIQGTLILKNVSLEVEKGEFLSLLGPSGCGKSTLLKAISGILPQDSGEVWLAGEEISSKPPHRRGTVVVFQDMRLFPHLSAAENVAFPLKMRGVSKKERLERAGELLEQVQLAGFQSRAVSTLSGGQQQRVALARALAAQPRLLLLDEPFSSLDEDLREDMRALVLSLHRRYRMTTVLVTHDQQEALAMSDHVALMFGGEIVQHGTPEAVYRRPVSRLAADYFGGCFYLSGEVWGGWFTSPCLTCPADLPDGPCSLMLRGRDVDVSVPGPLALTLEGCRFRGADVLAKFHTGDGTAVEVSLREPLSCQPGCRIDCHVDLSRAVFYPAGEGGRP